MLPKSTMKITQGTVVLLSPDKPGRDRRVWPHFASTVTYWQDDSIKLIAKVITPSDGTPCNVSCALSGAIENAYLWVVPTCKISSHLRCRDALSAIYSTQNVRQCASSIWFTNSSSRNSISFWSNQRWVHLSSWEKWKWVKRTQVDCSCSNVSRTTWMAHSSQQYRTVLHVFCIRSMWIPSRVHLFHSSMAHQELAKQGW